MRFTLTSKTVLGVHEELVLHEGLGVHRAVGLDLSLSNFHVLGGARVECLLVLGELLVVL